MILSYFFVSPGNFGAFVVGVDVDIYPHPPLS